MTFKKIFSPWLISHKFTFHTKRLVIIIFIWAAKFLKNWLFLIHTNKEQNYVFKISLHLFISQNNISWKRHTPRILWSHRRPLFWKTYIVSTSANTWICHNFPCHQLIFDDTFVLFQYFDHSYGKERAKTKWTDTSLQRPFRLRKSTSLCFIVYHY